MKNIIKTFMFVVVGALLFSCSAFNDDTDPYNVTEASKDLSGVWKLKTVTRNNIDITNQMDFTQFTLSLNHDGTYSIQNYIPFIVREDGTWGIDNPDYPFLLTFKESSSSEATNVELSYPVVDGKRALSITHSPGCFRNSYTFTMERVSTGN